MRKKPLYERIRQILESARTGVARTVNTTQVVSNWLIGREIVEEEQQGKHRADYGKQLVEDISTRLQGDFGKGYSALNLWLFRRFYLEYPDMASMEILYAPRKESGASRMSDASRRKLDASVDQSGMIIGHALRSQSWKPGQLHPNLSWTHYRTLLRVDKRAARAFYEIEAIQNNWSARELERQT